MRIGVYPGSFNPPTVAHLAIATAAVAQCGLDRLDLVLSRDALGKVDAQLVPIEDRLHILEAVTADHPQLGTRITDVRYIVDIAAGYDVVVLGADKWEQVVDPVWYGGSRDQRDWAIAHLPEVAFAPRTGHESERPPLLPAGATVLHVEREHREISASQVRQGRREWMLDAARRFDDETGAWSDPDRYAAWRAAREPAPGA